MKFKLLLAALAACVGLGVAGLPVAGGPGVSEAYADGYRVSGHTKRHAWGTRGTRVHGYVRRGGYYSYTDEDAVDTFAWARSLFSSVSRFRNPWTEKQTGAGPFDSGFFFDSDLGSPYNDAPYPR